MPAVTPTSPAPSLEALTAQLTALRPRLDAVSLAIHARPELKFAEFHAQALLSSWLAEAGFSLVLPAGGG
ncbi:hypothetical protein [Parafrankia sp. FMc2]|uniref:hypothetical protein n=1 Tax=Parafrankia sp. FMc2 TaxID=3233196 RepID=UPI0034D39E13